MKIKKPFFGLLLLIVVVSLLASCSLGTAKTTEDPMLIYTQAQQTVAAQLTGTAAMMPTVTETPLPTNTPEPTAPDIPQYPPTAGPVPDWCAEPRRWH